MDITSGLFSLRPWPYPWRRQCRSPQSASFWTSSPPVAVRGGPFWPCAPSCPPACWPHPSARRAGGAEAARLQGGTPPVLRSHRSLRRNGGAGPGAPLSRGLPKPGASPTCSSTSTPPGCSCWPVVFPVLHAPARLPSGGPLPAPEVLAQVEGVAARYGLKAPGGWWSCPGWSAFVCGPPAPGAGAPRPAGGRQGAPPRGAPPPPWRRVGRGGGVRPAVPALVQPLIWYSCDRIQNDCESPL